MYRFSLLLIISLTISADVKYDTLYVNHETGNDANLEISESKPLKTFKKAFTLINKSGTVYIQKTKKPYTEKLLVKIGGSPNKPLKVIGTGAVIDLSTDISSGPWKKDGEYFIYDKIIKRSLGRSGLHQMAAFWVDKVPVHPFYHKYSKGKQKHYVTYLEDGKMKVKFPEGMDPTTGKHKILLNADFGQSAVSFGHKASHVIVDGLTVKHSGNDGFNLHGSAKDIHLTNVVSLFNGDEGISAHGHLQMKATNSIIAHNGSAAGGIADVGECETEYENCVVFNNNNCAFYFSATKHLVKNCAVWGNKKVFSVHKETEFRKENIFEFTNQNEAKNNITSMPKQLQKVVIKSLNLFK